MVSPRLVFVLSPYQNAFFGEIAEVLVHELDAAGADGIVIDEPAAHVVQDHDVFVIMPPHEFVVLEGRGFIDDPVLAARTIGLSAEQPHQPFFVQNAQLAAHLGAVVDFSSLAVAAYSDRGVHAHHLQFGYTALWDRFVPGPAAAGPPSVLYMGNKRPRRLALLAGAGPALGRHGARLIISDNSSPNRGTGPAFVAGDDKRLLLADTRLLINIHQSDERYFEWLRFVEAAHCGTPYLTERSIHTEPFIDGIDFESFEPDGLAQRIDELVADDQRLGALREAAYQHVRERPLSSTVGVLVEVAAGLLIAPPPRRLPAHTRTEPLWGQLVEVAATLPTVTMRKRSMPFARSTALALVGDGSPQLHADITSLDPAATLIDSSALTFRRIRRLNADTVVFAPPGLVPLPGGLQRLLAALDGFSLVAGVVFGTGAAGEPTLEGIWPWQTWRLGAGQHVGRFLAVRGDVVRAAADWLAAPGFAGAPHVAIAAWVAAHGGAGGHMSTPVARVVGFPLDPAQAVPADVALHCAQMLRLPAQLHP